MIKKILFFISIILSSYSFSQATLFEENFEIANPSWISSDDLIPNFWLINSCSGNGINPTGTNAMYISKGGAIPGCGPTGTTQYAYANSPSGSLMATNSITVDATCASGIQVTFDYKIDGVTGEDFGELVYSINGGTTWVTTGELASTSGWTITTISLPAAVDGINFELGFRFTYSDANVVGLPLAIDNITVIGFETIPPVAICPADTTIYVDANCDGVIPDYTSFVIGTDNCTSASSLLFIQNPPPSTVVNGTIIVTPIIVEVYDESGNFTTCTFDSRTIDTMVATISCPPDTNIYADASCDAFLGDYTSIAIAIDNCTPFSSLTVTQSPPAGTTITADQIITMTVSGAIPNIDQQCIFNGIFVDTISPAIVCPTANILYVDNTCDGLIEDYTSGPVIVENCTLSPLISQFPLPGTSVTVSDVITIILTVTDDSGNSSQCQFNQPIIDTISPSITCPSDQDENSDINCFATIGDYTSIITTADNCSGTFILTQSPLPGGSISTSTVITMLLDDGNGNTSSCLFNVNPIDVLAPTITCPATMDMNTDSGCNYILQDLTGMVSATDNCTPAISLAYSQSPLPTTPLAIGINSVTITVLDLIGNSDFCSFDINVLDQVDPVASVCPPNQNVYVDASCQGLLEDYTSLVTATDNCSAIGDLVINQNPVVNTPISSSTLITITIEDESGNSTTCIFNAIPLDTISPIVTCPSDQSIVINPSCEYTMPDLSTLVLGSDNCSILGAMTINQNPVVGSTQNGTTAVLITLIDEQGNSSTCITNMIPIDTDAPTINCPSPAIVDLGAVCDYSLPNYGTMSTVLDNCSGYSIDQIPNPGTIVNPGGTSITLIVTDAGGNTDQCTFVLDVIETQNPTIICPSDISTCNPIITYTDPIFNDNCFSYLTQTDLSGLTSGMNFPIGNTVLEYTVLDSSGNSQVCSFSVEILDFPSNANIDVDTIWLCDESSTVLNADAITSGTGLWTLISGQGNFNNQFANSTGVNNLDYGFNVFEWEVSSASCGTLSDTIVVFNSQQDIQASTQDTIYSCSDSSVILLANTPLFGVGTWSTNNGGIITNINSPNTSSTLAGSGWFDFIWTISNSSCPLNSDTLRVLSMQNPTIFQNDTVVCIESDLVTLSASIPFVGQTVNWDVISGSGTVSSPNTVTTDVFDFGIGNSLVMYSVSHPACPTLTDTIVVTASLCSDFDPVIPTVFTPGNFDGKNDVFAIDFLANVYPECYVVIFNRWGSVVYESIGYDIPWDGKHKGEDLPMGTYFYRIELNDGNGEVLKGDISIIR